MICRIAALACVTEFPSQLSSDSIHSVEVAVVAAEIDQAIGDSR
jgi:hypothetical protein